MPQISCHEKVTIFSALRCELERMRGAQAEVERLGPAGGNILVGDDYWPREIEALDAAIKKLRSVLS